ncbi:GDSL-type esterase/lipase family protein [Parvularcula sp. LCG005]|uniref:GDSL-type esterase/lipase family protein n=1 Tax=Parvularcula sp. LCG005 TaxID=3078805 RepID=UPI00294230B8|nr:GDSL-type esterase/lipase family protein [Parvularcula sp. LCG005]WOI53463.1 GDSL-type esterase/lipase family protein [Parvularcula sp. LCG005]
MNVSKWLGVFGLSALAGCGGQNEGKLMDDTGPVVEGISIWPGFVPDGRAHVAGRLPVLEAYDTLDGGVIFLGDSITEGADLPTLFPRVETRNFGIGWDTTDGVLTRLSQLARHHPDRLFLLIGTNDTGYDHGPDHIALNIIEIVHRLQRSLPETDIYVLSILPRETAGNMTILPANRLVAEAAQKEGFTFLNIAPAFAAEDGTMLPELTGDGLHLNDEGYTVFSELLRPCVEEGCEGL